MTKIISALALLAVLAAATSSCSSNNAKKTIDSSSVETIEELAPVTTDTVSDSIPALPSSEQSVR